VPLYPTFFLSCGCFVVHHYSNGLAYYFSFKSNKVLHQEEDKRISDVRNLQVLDNHAGKAIGLDVSEYQGKINWVMWILGKYPVHFVFIRHRGMTDNNLRKLAWRQKHQPYPGAYHYRPNENSLEQATLY
jgi:lysozyme